MDRFNKIIHSKAFSNKCNFVLLWEKLINTIFIDFQRDSSFEIQIA